MGLLAKTARRRKGRAPSRLPLLRALAHTSRVQARESTKPSDLAALLFELNDAWRAIGHGRVGLRRSRCSCYWAMTFKAASSV